MPSPKTGGILTQVHYREKCTFVGPERAVSNTGGLKDRFDCIWKGSRWCRHTIRATLIYVSYFVLITSHVWSFGIPITSLCKLESTGMYGIMKWYGPTIKTWYRFLSCVNECVLIRNITQERTGVNKQGIYAMQVTSESHQWCTSANIHSCCCEPQGFHKWYA